MKYIRRFIADESGQDLIEYSLLLVFIALCALGILPQLGNSINAVFSRSDSALKFGTGS